MSWILIVSIAYFLNAISAIIDKTIISNSKSKVSPLTYTFSIASLATILILIVVPFGWGLPHGHALWISLVAGVVNITALVLMFKALEKDEASRVLPMIGGLTPVFILILAGYLLQEHLFSKQYFSFVLLIVGIFLISMDFQKHGVISWLKKKLTNKNTFDLPKLRTTIKLALPAAILFAVFNILSKFVYDNSTFWTGFLWINVGTVITGIFLLIPTPFRKEILSNLKKQKKQPSDARKTTGRFLFGQSLAAIGNILRNYAIFLGSVTLVNALQGLQYAFIFIIAVLLTIFLPKLLKEDLSKEIVIQKVTAIFIITLGLYFIAF